MSDQNEKKTAPQRPTPQQTKGPFYPVYRQADYDNDLTTVGDSGPSALGDALCITGSVMDQHLNPIAGARVEIWQACASGRYHHFNDPNPAPLDAKFQYSGRDETDSRGIYQFKTIQPGSYPVPGTDWVRAPHIHFRVIKPGYVELVTQVYFSGNPLNEKDLILLSVPPIGRPSVILTIKPGSTPKFGSTERLATFNINLVRLEGSGHEP